MPAIPGSRRTFEDIAGIGRFNGRGVAEHAARRMRRQDRNHRSTLIAKPQNHTRKRRTGAEPDTGSTAAIGNCCAGMLKGWPICFATKEKAGRAIPDAVDHANRVPRLINSEKGTRNFSEAASQIQYRTAARFFFNLNTNNHATAAQTVDCQRWFPKGCLLYTSPSPRDRQKSRMPSS